MSSFTAGLEVCNVRAVLKSILEFRFPVFYFRYWHFSIRDSYPFSWSLFSSLLCYVFSFLHTDSFCVTVISTWKLRLGTYPEVAYFGSFRVNYFWMRMSMMRRISQPGWITSSSTCIFLQINYYTKAEFYLKLLRWLDPVRTWTIDEIDNRWQSITIDDNRYQLIDWYW